MVDASEPNTLPPRYQQRAPAILAASRRENPAVQSHTVVGWNYGVQSERFAEDCTEVLHVLELLEQSWTPAIWKGRFNFCRGAWPRYRDASRARTISLKGRGDVEACRKNIKGLRTDL